VAVSDGLRLRIRPERRSVEVKYTWRPEGGLGEVWRDGVEARIGGWRLRQG